MMPLWIDTDACHDGAIALLLACALPYFDLIGISTTYGRVSLDYATRNANSILAALQVENVLVFPGEAKPALGKLPPQIQGSGLDGTGLLSLPQGPKQPDHSALSALASVLERYPPQQLCIVCLGPLTNIALLAMNHPELIPLIDVISISAGIDNCNLRADPHATDVIMNLVDVIAPHVPSGTQVPQVLISEASPEVKLSPMVLEHIKRGYHLDKYTVFRQMMFELLANYADHVRLEVCDPIAIVSLLPQRLGIYLGIEYTDSGLVRVTDSEPLWKLVLESIEELEASDM